MHFETTCLHCLQHWKVAAEHKGRQPGLFVTRSVSEEFSVFFLADASGYDARRFGQDSRNSFVDVHVGRTLADS